MVKVFTSAPAEERPEYPGLTPLPFQLPGDEHVYKATPPKRAIWQRVTLAQRAKIDPQKQAALLVEYLRGTMSTPGDLERLEGRLLDPVDRLDLADLWQVISWLSRTWTYQVAHPGELPPGEEAAIEGETGEVTDVVGPPVLDGETAGPAVDAAPVDPATAEAPAVQPALPPVPPAS